MANWFETRRQANGEVKRRQEKSVLDGMDRVWRWKWTKRKKPFFVGSYIEWINQ